MAAYTKAWVIPWDTDQIGIAYELSDGTEGFMRLDRVDPDLPQIMRLLNDADLKKVEEKLRNVVPFPRSRIRSR